MAPEINIGTGCDTGGSKDAGAGQRTKSPGLVEVLQKLERDLILAALRESRGNKAKAARALGISERLMGLRVKRLGIDWRGLRACGKRIPAERSYQNDISDHKTKP